MRVAYLDCFSGLAGDMFLGALLHAGLSLEALNSELAKLGLDEFRLDASVGSSPDEEVYGTACLQPDGSWTRSPAQVTSY